MSFSSRRTFFKTLNNAKPCSLHPGILPFLTLSDINIPKLSGLELRAKLKTDADLAVKCIPYLFFSAALNQKIVVDAYIASVQVFFVKHTSLPELEKTISIIVEYWKRCAAPNNFL